MLVHSMKRDTRIVRVFIASPGDVEEERNRVEVVIDEINRTLDSSYSVRLESIRWETHVAPLMGRPQEVVLDQVEITELDIFVGILWLRFGTPTGANAKDNQNPFLSGTEEEFNVAYESWKLKGKPQILFYRCTKAPRTVHEIDVVQFSRVGEFFNRFSPGKDHPGYYRSFQSPDEFERRLREDLNFSIREFFPNNTVERGAELNNEFQKLGFRKLFLPGLNEERNSLKRKVLGRAKEMNLLAHSGHSYFGSVGHRFRDEIVDRLNSGSFFKAVLTNPWSDTGLFMALAELEFITVEDVMNFYQKGELAGYDPIDLIEKTVWYSIKFKGSMAGYKQLAKQFGEKIEIRFTKFEFPATMLLTENEAFYEPYLHINLRERLQKSMLTFETYVSEHSHLYRHSEAFFKFMWDVSEPADIFLSNEESHKKQLIEKYSPKNNKNI